MKTKHLLLFILIAVISSCSSAYKIGQTPDDVYYSPAPPPPVEYVKMDNQQDKDSYAGNNTDNIEDLAIRRGINDPMYRSNGSLNFGFGYNPYDYYGSSLFSPYSSYYNPYTYTGVTFYPYNYNYYNSYYSPFNNYYYPPVYIIKNGTPASNYSGPRTVNLGAYNNNSNTNRVNTQPGRPATNTSAPLRAFQTPQPSNRSGVGNFIRRVFTPSENNRSENNRSYGNDNNANNNSSPARTTQTNTSGSSSGSSSSSGNSSAPVRSFRK
ncbi:MAG: hypothetical protein ABI863_15655 [Ginsengibacter sp.]